MIVDHVCEVVRNGKSHVKGSHDEEGEKRESGRVFCL